MVLKSLLATTINVSFFIPAFNREMKTLCSRTAIDGWLVGAMGRQIGGFLISPELGSCITIVRVSMPLLISGVFFFFFLLISRILHLWSSGFFYM